MSARALKCFGCHPRLRAYCCRDSRLKMWCNANEEKYVQFIVQSPQTIMTCYLYIFSVRLFHLRSLIISFCVCCALSLFLYFWAHNIVHFSSRSFAGSLEFFVSMCSVVARSPISFVHFDHSPKWNKKPFLPSFCNASIFPFMQKALFSLSPSQVCAWLDHSHGCMVLAYLKLHKCTSTIIENVQHKKDFNAFFPRAIYFSFHFDVRKCVCARPTVCVW